MKKKILAFTVLATIACVAISFKHQNAAPKLYPELEAFFKSVPAKEFQKDQAGVLENMRENLNTSNMDYGNWNCVFYCTENSFRSQASQIFRETLCFSKRHKQVKSYSAGIHPGEINTKLIAYLSKIGYKISTSEKDGRKGYEVRYSDDANPVFLFAKSIDDKSLPKSNVASIIVCNHISEPLCSSLDRQHLPFELPFPNATINDSDEKIASIVKEIAVAMQYITEKKSVK